MITIPHIDKLFLLCYNIKGLTRPFPIWKETERGIKYAVRQRWFVISWAANKCGSFLLFKKV